MQHTNPLTEELTALLAEKPNPAPLWRRIGAGVVDAVGVYVFMLALLLSISIFLLLANGLERSFYRDEDNVSGELSPLRFHGVTFEQYMMGRFKKMRADYLGLKLPIIPLLIVSDTFEKHKVPPVLDILWWTAISFMYFIMATFYSPFFDSSRLQGTPGKWFFRLKVSDESGQRLTVKKAYLRSAGKVFTFATLGFGFISLFFNVKKQTWYDKRFKTLVTARG